MEKGKAKGVDESTKPFEVKWANGLADEILEGVGKGQVDEDDYFVPSEKRRETSDQFPVKIRRVFEI